MAVFGWYKVSLLTHSTLKMIFRNEQRIVYSPTQCLQCIVRVRPPHFNRLRLERDSVLYILVINVLDWVVLCLQIIINYYDV